MDADYDKQNVDLVFGLYNASDNEVAISSDLQVARVSFAWLGQYLPSYDEQQLPGSYVPNLQALRGSIKEGE